MSNSSSSGDDEFNKDTWVFYRDRPEWKDVAPVPQEDEDEVVAIAYSKIFTDVYDYLRAVMNSGEKSERALKLTHDAAMLNPANYTVWQYRREILKALDKDLHEELTISENAIRSNEKNYQVWHHRKVIVEWLNDADGELALTEMMLAKDAKNYHAWQHRQWAMKTYKLYENELAYVDSLITDDIRNNSAWNQRYFVVNNTTGFTPEVLQHEIDYTLEKIKMASENESAWNYLRGLLLFDKSGLGKNETVSRCCEEMFAGGNRSSFLLGLLIDICDERIEAKDGDSAEHLKRVKDLCDELASKYDTIRRNYWEYMAKSIEEKVTGKKSPTEFAGDGS